MQLKFPIRFAMIVKSAVCCAVLLAFSELVAAGLNGFALEALLRNSTPILPMQYL